MIAFGHSSTGVIIGVGAITLAQNGASLWWLFPLALIAGVISHYICDFIPHGHYYFGAKHLTTKSITLFLVDFIGALILFAAIALHKFGLGSGFWLLATAILGAQLPDFYEAAIDFKILPKNNFAKAHRHWHYDLMHWHSEGGKDHFDNGTRAFGWIDLWQVGVFGVALWLLLRLPSR